MISLKNHEKPWSRRDDVISPIKYNFLTVIENLKVSWGWSKSEFPAGSFTTQEKGYTKTVLSKLSVLRNILDYLKLNKNPARVNSQ